MIANILNALFGNTEHLLCSCSHKIHLDYCDKIADILEYTKRSIILHEKEAKEQYLNIFSINYKDLDIGEDNIKQIEKDLARTFPGSKLYESKQGKKSLLNVLSAFSNYDKDIKYVQGMNFIVGSLLFHCDEYIAFWLFVELLENFELRNSYAEGFPDLHRHSENIKILLQKKNKTIYNVFIKHSVELEIFIVEWVFSLFSSIMPVEVHVDFFQGFFAEGWDFFYKTCLVIFENNQQLIEENIAEKDDIYLALRLEKSNESEDKSKNIEKWKEIIYKAYLVEVDEGDKQ